MANLLYSKNSKKGIVLQRQNLKQANFEILKSIFKKLPDSEINYVLKSNTFSKTSMNNDQKIIHPFTLFLGIRRDLSNKLFFHLICAGNLGHNMIYYSSDLDQVLQKANSLLQTYKKDKEIKETQVNNGQDYFYKDDFLLVLEEKVKKRQAGFRNGYSKEEVINLEAPFENYNSDDDKLRSHEWRQKLILRYHDQNQKRQFLSEKDLYLLYPEYLQKAIYYSYPSPLFLNTQMHLSEESRSSLQAMVIEILIKTKFGVGVEKK